MGSSFEINDTLQITSEQGFPAELDLARHLQKPLALSQFRGRIFAFHSKSGARLFHTPPTRVFLVHNIGGKWLYWGHCQVVEQTISTHDGKSTTSGKFMVTKIYAPEDMKKISVLESPVGKGYTF
jgi:hypothetical protein